MRYNLIGRNPRREAMGGETIKALNIFEQLHALVGEVTRIAHARNKAELAKHRLATKIQYLEDGR